MSDMFKHSEVKILFPGINPRSLISWSERKLLKPLKDADGRGSSREYSFTNLIEISIIDELFQYRIPFSQINLAMQNAEMKKSLNLSQYDSVFYILHKRIYEADSPEPCISLGIMNIKDFYQAGTEAMIGQTPWSSTSKVITSLLVINISAHYEYVKWMVSKLGNR